MKALETKGKVKLGLVLFIVLVAVLTGTFVYRYADPATRITEEAIELMGRDKFDSALAKLDEALQADPDHVQALYHRGICLAEKHRWDESMAAFQRVTELDPKEANAYFNQGKILWNLDRWEEALPPLEKAAEFEGRLEKANRKSVLVLIGECYYESHLDKLANDPAYTGSPAKAISAFRTYLQENPQALDHKAVEQKIDLLENPEKYKEELKPVLEKRKRPVPAEKPSPATLPQQ